MSYTVEDIKGMSDREINIQMTYITGGEFIDYGIIPEDQWPVHVLHYVEELGIPSPIGYCTDWSVTGPLMVEYGVSLILPTKRTPNHIMSEAICDDSYSVSANPLRAVCEIILMLNLKEG